MHALVEVRLDRLTQDISERTERVVAIAGDSGGGSIAQLAALSFPGAFVAYATFGWGEYPFHPNVGAVVGRAVARCALGLDGPKRPGAPDGYVLAMDREAMSKGFTYNTEPRVLDAMAAAFEPDACGALESIPAALAGGAVRATTARIPALVFFGDHDAFMPGVVQAQRLRYAATPSVTVATLAETGHVPMLGRTAPAFRKLLSGWLERHGF